MTRAGSFDTRSGGFTTRSGTYAAAGRLGEMIEDFEEGYPRRDGWRKPTWSGSAAHISDVDSSITRTGEGSLWVRGYFEDWCLPANLETPAAIGTPIRCWFRPFKWNDPGSPDRDGSQFWFTLGHPTENSRNYRLELNTIYTGTARIRYRDGTAKTLDSLDGGTTYNNNAHNAIDDVWYAWDVLSPGCAAYQSSQFDEGETLPPGQWQFALHEDGEQESPVIWDAPFEEYQDWPGDDLKIGVWVGRSGDTAVFDDIQFLDEVWIPDDDEPEPDPAEEVLIDDFESYASGHLPKHWTVDGSGTADVDSSAALHPDSTQGVLQNGSSQIRSFPGQGLENYPLDGREISVLMQPDSSTSQPWIMLALESDHWSTEIDNWRFELHMDSGIRIVDGSGGGRDIVATDWEYSFNTGETYDCRIIPDTSSGIEFAVLNENGSVVASASTSETKMLGDEMSIGLRCGGGSRSVRWDHLRLIGDDSA